MRTHRGQPFQRREVLGCLAVLGCINDRPLLVQILRTLLGEGRPDDVTRQIFHSRIISGRYTVAAEDPVSSTGQAVKPGMFPCREHPRHLLRDLPLVQEHPEYLMPEEGLQLFQLQGWGDAEHALVAIETAVRHQNVTVRIESEKIAEGLDSDDGAGEGIIFRNRILEKNLQGFPGAAAKIGKKLPVPRSGRGQAPRKYLRRIFGMLNTK